MNVSSTSTSPGQRLVAILDHELVAYEVRHPPRGLVRDAKLTLKVLGGHRAASARHQVHRVEPKVQRRSRAVEDRPCGRMDVVAARVARPRRPRPDLVELACLLALRAVSVL